MKVLLDSVILIDHLNGLVQASRFLEENLDGAVISVVTRAEVLVGFGPAERADVEEWLGQFPLLALGAEEADLCATLRREHRWKLPDAFQAALAQCHKLKLATRNTKDFPAKRLPWVLNPYKL
jgi:hypothetical protein